MNRRRAGSSRELASTAIVRRQSSIREPTTDDDSEHSRCPSPLNSIEGGMRGNPLAAFPVKASQGVKFMADYCEALSNGHAIFALTQRTDIQVWAPQQAAQAYSVNGEKNSLISLVIPRALQNAMLFEATIAMTRAAWVLRRGSEPFADKMMLRHRGMALRGLRDALSSGENHDSAQVLLTMSNLLTMNYMIDDVQSFEVHLRALERMVNAADDQLDRELKTFVQGRVSAFGVLASFMHAQQPSYASRINEPGHRISALTYPGHPFLPELCALIAKLPEGFAEIALSRNIAIELISFTVKLIELVGYMALDEDARSTRPKPEMTMQRTIYDLQCLSALPLTAIEAQIVRALLCFCLHLYNDMFFHIPLARPLRPILVAFNKYSDLPREIWQQRCLIWCSIVVASAWDRQIDTSPEPHSVLDRMLRRTNEARDWQDVQQTMRKFLWIDRLADQWEVCWRAATFTLSRQRRGASQIEMGTMSQLMADGRYSATQQSSTTPSSDGRNPPGSEPHLSPDSGFESTPIDVFKTPVYQS